MPQNVFGRNNFIDLQCDEESKNKIWIEINGNNNIVIVEKLVEVADKLEISIVDDNCQVYIGKGSTFEETIIAVADNNNKVTIGEDCMFARNTKILASDFHSIIDLQTGMRKNRSREVIIDNHVWVGFGATVLKNTHIMSNSIVGADIVAYGVVPPNGILGRKGRLRHKKVFSEITWERSRDSMIVPSCKKKMRYRKKRVANCDVQFNIENNFKTCMNKIQGWAFLSDIDSTESIMYMRFEYLPWKRWELILPLNIVERCDVADAFNDMRYKYCGLLAYMPSEIICNRKNYTAVELIIENGEKRGIVKLV